MSHKQVSLYYKDGGSDKVYHLQIEKDRDGYSVNYQYGRRGSTLQSGTKNSIPVELKRAEEIFSKLLVDKTSKGYTPGEDGTPFSQSENAGKVSGLVPQLLNPIDESEVQKYLDDFDWMMQEKMDGVRLMIKCAASNLVGEPPRVTCSNRKGLIVPGSSVIEKGIVTMCHSSALSFGPVILDGEAIGDVYHLFDVLEANGQDFRSLGPFQRWVKIRELFGSKAIEYQIKMVETAYLPEHKNVMFRKIKTRRGEGVVFKKANAPYVPGRPNSGGNQVKFKFVSSATCQVIGLTTGKRSIQLGLTDPVTGIVDVGKVTILPNFEIPQIGRLVEVRYLYAYPGGSLYQPVYCGERTDKVKPDVLNTLKFKQGTDEEDS